MCVCSTTSCGVSKWTKRCFPFDSTRDTRDPTISSPRAAALAFGATTSKPVTTSPASARRRTVAARWIVSPSGTAQQIPARRARETRVAERRGERRLVDGDAVDLVDEERRPPLGHGLRGERSGDERAPPRDVALLALDVREHRTLVARDERGERAVDQDHERARRPRRASALLPYARFAR